MPFKKKGKFYYHKGRKYTKKQVVAYHASGGTFSKAKSKLKSHRPSMSKKQKKKMGFT